MRYRITLFLIALFSVYTFICVMPASADHKQRQMEYLAQRQAMLEDIFRELNLTQEQQAQIKQNRDAQKKIREMTKNKIKAKRSALRSELEKENATKESVDAMANELIELMGQRIRSRVGGVWAVKQILTPEQFKTFQLKNQEFMEKHGMQKIKKGD